MNSLVKVFTILRNIVFGLIFMGVGGYLVVGEFMGYNIEFPGDILNYIFGIIAIAYGIMRLFMYKRGC